MYGPSGRISDGSAPLKDEEPLWEWGAYFSSGRRPAPIRRPRLIDAALTGDARWIEIAGIVGLGRTTLLDQLRQELQSRGEHALMIRHARHAGTLLGLFQRSAGLPEDILEAIRAAEARPADAGRAVDILAPAIASHAARAQGGRFTLLIDDFDWCIAQGYAEQVVELMERVPALRLVTVTIKPVPQLHSGAGRLLRSRQLLFEHLAFDDDEIARLASRLREESDRAPDLDADQRRRLLQTTAGIPLAVGIALDRAIAPGHSIEEGFTVALADAAIRSEIHRQYPGQPVLDGPLQLLWLLSFLPRFTLQHLSVLEPGADYATVNQLTGMRTVDPAKVMVTGEFVWSDAAWESFTAWNRLDFGMREMLAAKLEEIGDIAGIFEQWILGGEFQRANRLLHGRFPTIFEETAPEAIECLLRVSSQELRKFPHLRVMHTLINPLAEEADLVAAAETMAFFARKREDPEAKLVALAVRAVVLTRTGQRRPALRQAQEVLEALAALASGRGAGSADEEPIVLSEARLIAVLVTFANGSYPERRVVFKRAVGHPFLDQRVSGAQLLLDTLGLQPRRGGIAKPRPQTLGYRALVYSETELFAEVKAWNREDVLFKRPLPADAPAIAGSSAGPDLSLSFEELFPRLRGGGPPPPAILRDALECAALLLVGNTGEAFALVRDEMPAPISHMVNAILALAISHPQEALAHLDAVDESMGLRIQAIVGVLRASAKLRLGRKDAAIRRLNSLADLPPEVIRFGATTALESDLQALAELVPWFAPFAEGAMRVGFMGSGMHLSTDEGVQPLTRRERDVLTGIAEGLGTKEIAEHYFLSVNTVKTHQRSLSKKIGASGRAEIVRRAKTLGLLG